jgi:hypothetical protein
VRAVIQVAGEVVAVTVFRVDTHESAFSLSVTKICAVAVAGQPQVVPGRLRFAIDHVADVFRERVPEVLRVLVGVGERWRVEVVDAVAVVERVAVVVLLAVLVGARSRWTTTMPLRGTPASSGRGGRAPA